MSTMFWIWIGVIVITAVIEAISMDLVSIWFTAGAIIPLILSACTNLSWEWQLLIFIALSSILIISLRKVTMKLLFKNSNSKTNMDAIIGRQVRMLERTDFETPGSVKINDVVWTAIGDKGQTIAKNAVVEIVSISGNKLKVKKVNSLKETPTPNNSAKTSKSNNKDKTKGENE